MIRTRFLLKALPPPASISNTFINIAVLQAFKNIKGNLKIPDDYVVGQTIEDAKLWPAHYKGFKLGSYAQFIVTGIKEGRYGPSVAASIAAMGLEVTTYQSRNSSNLLLAASTYVRLFGNGEVPSTFQVPLIDSRWPEETRGMKLGRALENMRYDKNHHAAARQSLIDAGISFDFRLLDNEVCMKAMKTYQTIEGDAKVEKRFVVPLDDTRYDPEARGIQLGRWLERMRHNPDNHPQYTEQLIALGVDFTVKKNRTVPFDVVYSALCTYYFTHGHLKIPTSYTVPPQDPLYPEEAWGLHLYRFLHWIKQGGYTKHKEQLESLGLGSAEKKFTHLPFQLLYDCLVVYRMIHGHLNVNNRYVIPLDDERYPEGARGATLGRSVLGIRLYNTWKEHRESLEALGLDLSKKRENVSGDFDTVYACLVAYKRINGHLYVPRAFQVPENDERYPEELRGFKLGNVAMNIKMKGYYSKHTEELQRIGFPLEGPQNEDLYAEKFISAMLVYQKLHGSVEVPYRFSVPADVEEYPEETRGMRLDVALKKFKSGAMKVRQGDNRLETIGLKL